MGYKYIENGGCSPGSDRAGWLQLLISLPWWFTLPRHLKIAEKCLILYSYPHHKEKSSHCSSMLSFHVLLSIYLFITSDHLTLKPGCMLLLFTGCYELLDFSRITNAIIINPGFLYATTWGQRKWDIKMQKEKQTEVNKDVQGKVPMYGVPN